MKYTTMDYYAHRSKTSKTQQKGKKKKDEHVDI